MFRGSVKGTGYPLQSPVSPSLPLPCVTVCHHISTGLYLAVDDRTANTRVAMVFGTARIMGMQQKKRKNLTSNDRVPCKNELEGR